MAGTAVVAMGCGGQQPVDVPVVTRSVRALMDSGWNTVLVPPPAPPGADLAGSLTLAMGQSRSGRRAVPVVTHILVDPADPALAHPPATAQAEPLAVLEAEAIAALVESGFPVVVSGRATVVPFGEDYRPVDAPVDEAACVQRLAGDLGAATLVFVAADDGPLLAGGPTVGEIDLIEAERRLADGSRFDSEFRSAVRFLRAGGDLAVITAPSFLAAAFDALASHPLPQCDGQAGTRMLRIRRTLVRSRSEAPVLTAGWC